VELTRARKATEQLTAALLYGSQIRAGLSALALLAVALLH
jgi:hypothetical protein